MFLFFKFVSAEVSLIQTAETDFRVTILKKKKKKNPQRIRNLGGVRTMKLKEAGHDDINIL